MNKVLEFPSAVAIPTSERVLDRLADILLATDEILDLVRPEERLQDARAVLVERSMQGVYDSVNELMKTLSD
jgi:hypothetical protein